MSVETPIKQEDASDEYIRERQDHHFDSVVHNDGNGEGNKSMSGALRREKDCDNRCTNNENDNDPGALSSWNEDEREKNPQLRLTSDNQDGQKHPNIIKEENAQDAPQQQQQQQQQNDEEKGAAKIDNTNNSSNAVNENGDEQDTTIGVDREKEQEQPPVTATMTEDDWKSKAPDPNSPSFPTSFVTVLRMMDDPNMLAIPQRYNLFRTEELSYKDDDRDYNAVSSYYSFEHELFHHKRHGNRKGIKTRARLRKLKKDGDPRLSWHQPKSSWLPAEQQDLKSFVEVLIEIATDYFMKKDGDRVHYTY